MPHNLKNYILEKDILLKYKNMDIFFLNCIKSLSGAKNIDIQQDYFFSKDMLKQGRNDLSSLKKLINKTGVYIFLDSNNIPVYIGKGGTSKEIGGRDLKYRIGQELGAGNQHNTLSNKIIKIEGFLQNKKISKEDSINIFIKKFSITTITVDERMINEKINLESIDKVEALETILIALLSPKYN